MQTLELDLGSRSYPIYIGENLLSNEALLKPHIPHGQVFIVTNDVVAPLYLSQLEATLKKLDLNKCDSIILKDGESEKNLDTLSQIFDGLIAKQHNRGTTLIALGGGVVGDMTGFAAACYQRGVNFIQIPTTLLAQVDSSVGGKTAVNHPSGKNMIGAFYQPKAVICDTTLLSSLPKREFSAGVAEVIKYGLICDAPFFQWLSDNIDALMDYDADILIEAVKRSCQNKADVVAEDEKETGRRAILNLGHTFGHAIESATHYKQWLHGEAVAMGTVMAANLSQRLGYIEQQDVDKIRAILERAELPVDNPMLDKQQMLELMAVDKKVISGDLRLVLLKSIGDAVVESMTDIALLSEILTHN